jgi:hypothetical protein
MWRRKKYKAGFDEMGGRGMLSFVGSFFSGVAFIQR